MSGIVPTFQHINPNNSSDSFDSSSLLSTSTRSVSPYFSNWKINYKLMPKKSESKGIWDGYQTQDEFITMHLR